MSQHSPATPVLAAGPDVGGTKAALVATHSGRLPMEIADLCPRGHGLSATGMVTWR